MARALVHKPSDALAGCELTFIERDAIDIARARSQHAGYVEALRRHAVSVEVVDVNPSCPDAVFVEDVAIVFDQLAVITSMGSESRRAELAAMRSVLSRYREVLDVSLPATLEGGDVLRIGKTLYVGESSRTNSAGIAALDAIARPLGFSTVPVKVPGCLHLKTCITALDDETCIVNPRWLDCQPFNHLRLIEVATHEPWGANVVRLSDTLLVNAAYVDTNERIASLGYAIDPLDISEFGKAEAGLTCMSLLFM